MKWSKLKKTVEDRKISQPKQYALKFILLTALIIPQCSAKDGPRNFIAKDDGAANASFTLFRTNLLEAIDKHDKAAVEEALADHIETSIGGAKGIEAFEKLWQGLGDDSKFWVMAKKVLEHGAQFDRESNEFHAPAISFEDSHSDFPQGIVWSKNALVYTKAEVAAPSKKAVYNDQLTILEPKEHKPLNVQWLKVKTRLGKVGYMKADDVSSSFDDFAVFKKEDGKWRMTWFGFAEL